MLVPMNFVKHAPKHSVIMISGFISEDSKQTWSSLRDVIASQGMGVFDFEWESITYEQLSNGVKDQIISSAQPLHFKKIKADSKLKGVFGSKSGDKDQAKADELTKNLGLALDKAR